ncbi:GGDEF domain-containing protein [Synechococcus sp. CS-1332]|uniref:GGDEF domain-containing protein n=1 Tax=Synechococcus sp. CS-1332 TaxID=2847972 RepID=UPI00223B2B78|nr:GGDEF domain-containing protein [Synechococcus sp. CS-1332]MCT0208893.1 GGDEF domain-containing protein [Synechococcus sp. CS-1332]
MSRPIRLPRGLTTSRQGLLLALLAGLAVLGNVATVPLFFSIQILLGPIASTLTLLWLRGWWSVAIAIMASLYTWKLWGHPWAILIFSAEALWLAVFVNRLNGPPENDFNGRIIFADIAYWLLVGTPLVLFLYGGVLDIDPTNVTVTAAKQAVNGMTNTVVAFLLFVLVQVWHNSRGRGLLPLRGIVFSLVLASITLPSLALTLLSGNLLQTATQEGVLENLRTVGEAAVWTDPRAFGPRSRGLPASVGAAAFLLKDRDGNVISSNPALFLRLATDFRPAPQEHIKVNGLQILVPRGERPALRLWIRGYWSTTIDFRGQPVQVVKPARPVVLKLQAQSAAMLTTLIGMTLLGALLSELVATLIEKQLRPLDQPLADATEPPALSGRPGAANVSGYGSLIAEIHSTAHRLQEHRREEARLRQNLAAMSGRLEQSIEQQRLHCSTDSLTGASNRSELDSSLQRVAERACACSVPLSSLAFAVQGLRQINMLHGRQKGDEVLRQLIADVKQLLHPNDELFRIGGNEFLLLLWDQPLESARTTAEQIRRVVSEAELPPCHDSSPRLEINAGLSLQSGSDPTGKTMLSRVELALSQSRGLGTHQVVVR